MKCSWFHIRGRLPLAHLCAALFFCSHAAADASQPRPDKKTKTTAAAKGDSSKQVKPMRFRNPYFTLHIQTESMPYGVYVNGAPLAADETGGPSSETWPINHMLRPSGDNEISLLSPPYESEDGKGAFDKIAKATLTVLVQEADHLDRPGVPLMKLCFVGASAGTPRVTEGSTPDGQFDSALQFTAVKAGDVAVSKPRVRTINDDGVLLISRTFSAGLSLPEWEFLRSDSVPTLWEGTSAQAERLYADLLAAYEVVWTAFKSGDIDSIMPLFEERSRNTDRAFYLKPGTTQQRLRESLVEALRDRSLTLQPIKADDFWSLEIGPGGRLMRLVKGAHSSAILRFEDKDGLSHVFPVTFRRKNGRYVIAL